MKLKNLVTCVNIYFRIRLAEGFNFAYSAAGILNTVMEVQMKGPGNDDVTYPCIVQYILFPPHVIVGPGGLEKDSGSDEETDEGNISIKNAMYAHSYCRSEIIENSNGRYGGWGKRC